MSRIRRSEDKYNRAFVKRILDAEKSEPEATFDNVEDMLRWLDEDAPIEPEESRS